MKPRSSVIGCRLSSTTWAFSPTSGISATVDDLLELRLVDVLLVGLERLLGDDGEEFEQSARSS